MNRITLGRSGIEISRIIMGTWQAGKDMWAGIDDADTVKALRTAYEYGITTFDTASAYGNGHSEKIVGKALAGVRSHVVYATKVFANRLRYDQVISSCERSLQNLGTDVIDLFQIHWPSGAFGTPKVPIEESMKAMEDLKTQGKIRSVGVSNFSRKQIQEASQFGRIDSLQPPYSLFWRHVESDAAPYCVENGITLLAYSPMAQGFLSGKFGPDHTFSPEDHRSKNRLFQPDLYPVVQEAVGRLRPIAEQYGITLAQLALAWVVSHPGTCAIAGARDASQVSENAGAADITLSPEVLAEMDRIGRTVTDRLDANPVMWKF